MYSIAFSYTDFIKLNCLHIEYNVFNKIQDIITKNRDKHTKTEEIDTQ